MSDIRDLLREIEVNIDTILRRIGELKTKIDSLTLMSYPNDEQLSIIKDNIERLNWKLNALEQETMICDLEIGEVPEVENENLVQLMMVLAYKLAVPLGEYNIVFAMRLGSRWSREPQVLRRPRRIAVRLTSCNLRNALLASARARPFITSTEVGLPGNVERIYFNERLSRVNRRLLYLARLKCGTNGWRFAWSKQGTIFVRQNELMPRHAIRNENDLREISMQSSRTTSYSPPYLQPTNF